MTTVTTPPPPPAPQPQAPEPPRRTSATLISVIAIVVGAVLIVGAVATAVFSVVRSGAVRTETFRADAAGITRLDVDVSTADLQVVYGSTGDVELVVDGTPGDWRLERSGDALTVRTQRGWFSGWLFGSEVGDRAVLTLPAPLESRGLDAELAISAGSIRADGEFGEVGLDLSAGAIEVSGSADTLDVDVSAGRATIDLADVRTGGVRVSAGAVDGQLSGAAPSDLSIDVSAGQVRLGLPDAEYDVASDVSAGDFDNRLNTSTSASARITVNVSAGEVVLSPLR